MRRIILLTILFTIPLYYHHVTESPEAPVVNLDAIKVRASAPERVAAGERKERILTVEASKSTVAEETVTEDEEGQEGERPSRSISAASSELEQVEEVQLSELEEGWNLELKNMLARLEPADADNIHKAYTAEQESYQAELDALMNEKGQKTSEEAIQEIDQLIGQLDAKHQEHLKEILGAHYEAVRGHYEEYMDSASSQE